MSMWLVGVLVFFAVSLVALVISVGLFGWVFWRNKNNSQSIDPS